METEIKEIVNLDRVEIKKESKGLLKDKELNKGVCILALVNLIINIVNSLSTGLISIICSCATIFVSVYIVKESLGVVRRVKPNLEQSIKELGGGVFKLIGAALLVGICVIFGCILFIVPGIIFSLMFLFTIHILVDNPEYGIVQAMKESARLTKGHKAELFVMQLSFLGWLFLVAITLGIAALYVTPYMNIAFSNYYTRLVKLDK